MEDYTIDYEEYFNRQMVWCVEWGWKGAYFNWNTWTWWYCTKFTAYWNENSTTNKKVNEDDHDIYYCSSDTEKTKRSWPTVVQNSKCGRFGTKQSFWQYAALFTDVHDGSAIIVWDDDDEELWKLLNSNVDAIADGRNIQELYLISHDWKSRLYFRRKNIAPEGKEPHYKIQMLRLRWFDAWHLHKFSTKVNSVDNDWLYDGKIDTWACDTSMWFEPKASHKTHNIWGAYTDYYLPQDAEDCRIDLTYWSTNLFSWNISISPLWDADLYRADQNHQINAYMRIMTVNSIYIPDLTTSTAFDTAASIRDFKVPLETTINMKDFYRWYSE